MKMTRKRKKRRRRKKKTLKMQQAVRTWMACHLMALPCSRGWARDDTNRRVDRDPGSKMKILTLMAFQVINS
jgi:hypothetical protein